MQSNIYPVILIVVLATSGCLGPGGPNDADQQPSPPPSFDDNVSRAEEALNTYIDTGLIYLDIEGTVSPRNGSDATRRSIRVDQFVTTESDSHGGEIEYSPDPNRSFTADIELDHVTNTTEITWQNASTSSTPIEPENDTDQRPAVELPNRTNSTPTAYLTALNATLHSPITDVTNRTTRSNSYPEPDAPEHLIEHFKITLDPDPNTTSRLVNRVFDTYLGRQPVDLESHNITDTHAVLDFTIVSNGKPEHSIDWEDVVKIHLTTMKHTYTLRFKMVALD